MKKEDKELLLRDLCARLPYGVKCQAHNGTLICVNANNGIAVVQTDRGVRQVLIENLKPYLRSIKNMTEEEVKDLVKVKILSKYGKENDYGGLNNIKSIKNFWFSSTHNEWFCDVTFNTIDGEYTTCFSVGRATWETTIAEIDWLNKHHFDYRGLILMGLALEAPEGMYTLK